MYDQQEDASKARLAWPEKLPDFHGLAFVTCTGGDRGNGLRISRIRLSDFEANTEDPSLFKMK